jgi:hypothetical protein
MERFVAGPFLLAKESGKVPPDVLTVSACLADITPDVWAIDWAQVDDAERLKRAAQFGIDSQHLPDAVRWVADHFDGGGFVWPNLFLDAPPAREFHRRFVTVAVRLLQMSLPEEMVEHFLDLTNSPPSTPGFAPVGVLGVHATLARRAVLTDPGGFRGFEVLGFDGVSGFDSFRCNALDTDFERRLGAQFNRWGLINPLRDAIRCAEFANGETTCAVAWHPWLVTEHPL